MRANQADEVLSAGAQECSRGGGRPPGRNETGTNCPADTMMTAM